MDADVPQTVFIVDDDRDFLKTTCRWLQSEHVRVVTFESAAEFLQAFQPDHPGCLLLDIVMPKMSGIQLLEELNRRRWVIPTIAMTAHNKISYAVEALKLGAADFVEKPFSSKAVLVKLVSRVMKTAQYARKIRVEMAVFSEKLSNLTTREQEVLKLVVEGLSSNEIAETFGSTTSTVSGQRASIMAKLSVEYVAELVREMLRYSVATELDPSLASLSDFQKGRKPNVRKTPVKKRSVKKPPDLPSKKKFSKPPVPDAPKAKKRNSG